MTEQAVIMEIVTNWMEQRIRKGIRQPGKYTACLKVLDRFGCDTSTTTEPEV